MKKWLLVVLLAFQGCAAQSTSIRWASGDSVTIKWQHSWLDTAGNPDQIDKFLIYRKAFAGTAFSLVDSTFAAAGIDTPATQITLPMEYGEWVYGIVAVDEVGNQSIMHTSLDSTAIPPGWVLQTTTNPSKPEGLQIIK